LESLRGAGAVGVKHLDSVELGLLGNTISAATDGTGDVGAVAVAISVLAVASIVGKPGSTTAEVL
jgi:hypothetical protein